MAHVDLQTGEDVTVWRILEDGALPDEAGEWLVPLGRLKDEAGSLLEEKGVRIGALIETDTPHSDLAGIGNYASFAAIRFPGFGDGRGFSLAVRLRKDYGFNGDIRAIGHVIPDQAQFLLRAGFNTSEVPEERREAFVRAVNRYKHVYQSDTQGGISVLRQRHDQAGARRVS
ncbi:DUF934 domain-containing protein [Gimibacter soli]|uniref:DUF934 domain-containing protein n=1 Tax=Gimibacter soli TaxID=3024400 RepID=A0AAF0BMU9_9PROT|nr:DUF934 domain-containing protein [Gimibacter soli]WCL55021.1 DUF934 domain-containing protein [Gimibacter soli]